jgi:hypothetical protein
MNFAGWLEVGCHVLGNIGIYIATISEWET